MSKSKPSQWPSQLHYIWSSQYHSSVPAVVRLELESGPSNHSDVLQHSSLVAIRSISCPSHPADGQFGLFAVRNIPPNTHILDYIGEIHCDHRPNSDYDLSLCRRRDGVSVGIDASTMGNEARFINDYRGIRAKPNALFCDRRTATGELRMGIWSSVKGIKKGEEILVSYGKAWWLARVTPVGNASSIAL